MKDDNDVESASGSVESASGDNANDALRARLRELVEQLNKDIHPSGWEQDPAPTSIALVLMTIKKSNVTSYFVSNGATAEMWAQIFAQWGKKAAYLEPWDKPCVSTDRVEEK